MEPTSSGKMHLSKKCPEFTWRNAVDVKKLKGLSSYLFPKKNKKTTTTTKKKNREQFSWVN